MSDIMLSTALTPNPDDITPSRWPWPGPPPWWRDLFAATIAAGVTAAATQLVIAERSGNQQAAAAAREFIDDYCGNGPRHPIPHGQASELVALTARSLPTGELSKVLGDVAVRLHAAGAPLVR